MSSRPARVFAHAWTPAIAICAALAMLGAEVAGLRELHYVFKPLTTLLILGMAARAGNDEAVYRGAVIAGLALSFVGDVFLMLPSDVFAFGLGSFLLAHLAYLYALRRRAEWFRPLWPLLVYVLIAGGMLAFLWPHVPSQLKIAVAIYVIALAGMATQAACAWRVLPHPATASAALGGVCFVLSDAVLAIDRFAVTVPHSSIIVLSSYWLAQYCIAHSVSRTVP